MLLDLRNVLVVSTTLFGSVGMDWENIGVNFLLSPIGSSISLKKSLFERHVYVCL